MRSNQKKSNKIIINENIKVPAGRNYNKQRVYKKSLKIVNLFSEYKYYSYRANAWFSLNKNSKEHV